ncbi:ATP-binding protein, partial [Actinoplanes sp. NPDC051633]|uniref:ATP-binding protein n=1 Tax=Actinoplanes sp. NPDC051633 TaxID=3155670 RepID=UPI00342FE174
GASLTRQLLIFSRLEPSRPETVDLNIVVSETRDLLSRTLGEDIVVDTELADDLNAVRADRTKMEQVLLNLVMNARAAMPDGGVLRITTQNAGTAVVLSVTDQGHGMEPEVVRRAFEPFFTTRPKGQGTGLGLATAYGAVTDAGGSIEIDSLPGAGTTVRICLPATDAKDQTEGAAGTQPPIGANESVLLVEDEDAVRQMMLRQLDNSGYRVREAADPLEALRVFAADPQSFDLLLTDIVMPGMSGTQLAGRVRELRPELPVLYMSGYTAGHTPGSQKLPTDGSLLHKPFDRSTLLMALHRTLHSASGPTRSLPR